MSRVCSHIHQNKRGIRGFSLTEMLATLLIMTMASTLLATGVGVAMDTYHKTVNSANAQMALSTSLSVLRSELGTASDIRVVDDGKKVYYLSDDGYWASIQSATDGHRGLMKQCYAGTITTSVNDLTQLDDMLYPIVSDEAVSEPLHVTFAVDGSSVGDGKVCIAYLTVSDGVGASANELARVDNYYILLRFM